MLLFNLPFTPKVCHKQHWFLTFLPVEVVKFWYLLYLKTTTVAKRKIASSSWNILLAEFSDNIEVVRNTTMRRTKGSGSFLSHCKWIYHLNSNSLRAASTFQRKRNIDTWVVIEWRFLLPRFTCKITVEGPATEQPKNRGNLQTCNS